jgi:hypothetical protein
LAKRANVSLSTVRDFEKARRTPIGNNLQALQRAIEVGGLMAVFSRDGKPLGIAIAQRPVTVTDSTGGRDKQMENVDDVQRD